MDRAIEKSRARFAIEVIPVTLGSAVAMAFCGFYFGFFISYRCGYESPATGPLPGSPLDGFCRDWIFSSRALVSYVLLPVVAVVLGGIAALVRRRWSMLWAGGAAGAAIVALFSLITFVLPGYHPGEIVRFGEVPSRSDRIQNLSFTAHKKAVRVTYTVDPSAATAEEPSVEITLTDAVGTRYRRVATWRHPDRFGDEKLVQEVASFQPGVPMENNRLTIKVNGEIAGVAPLDD